MFVKTYRMVNPFQKVFNFLCSDTSGTSLCMAAIVVVQSLSHVWLFATPWITAHQASLSFTISWSLLKLMSIESVKPSNHLVLCYPLLLLPSIFHSIRVFSNEPALHIKWPKYWSFSFSISPSNEYSGLISFRMDWFDCLAVQGTLKSLLQHHTSEASILQHSAFFYGPTLTSIHDDWKTIALIRWTFLIKVMSLVFNALSGFVIGFLPRSQHLLISWLQSPSAVILEPKKIKSVICHEVMGLDAMSFLYVVLSQLFFTVLFHLHQQVL